MMDELTLALIARRAPTTAICTTYDGHGTTGTMCARCVYTRPKYNGGMWRNYAVRLATPAEARMTHANMPCMPCRKHFTFLTDEQLGELSSCATSS